MSNVLVLVRGEVQLDTHPNGWLAHRLFLHMNSQRIYEYKLVKNPVSGSMPGVSFPEFKVFLHLNSYFCRLILPILK